MPRGRQLNDVQTHSAVISVMSCEGMVGVFVVVVANFIVSSSTQKTLSRVMCVQLMTTSTSLCCSAVTLIVDCRRVHGLNSVAVVETIWVRDIPVWAIAKYNHPVNLHSLCDEPMMMPHVLRVQRVVSPPSRHACSFLSATHTRTRSYGRRVSSAGHHPAGRSPGCLQPGDVSGRSCC